MFGLDGGGHGGSGEESGDESKGLHGWQGGIDEMGESSRRRVY